MGRMRMRPTSTIVGRMLASASQTVDEPQPRPSDNTQLSSPEPVLASLAPDGIRACLFDLDGVLTQTSRVHAAAWKQMFDAFLLDCSTRTGEPFRPFEVPADYAAYVDGKLRQDGVRAFLASRAIVLDEGPPDDLPSTETVHGLGTRKNDLVLDLIRHGGVEAYPASVRFVEMVGAAGLRRAVVSASKNCHEVRIATGIEHLFEVRVDGLVAEQAGMRGKPAPRHVSGGGNGTGRGSGAGGRV
jgi:beta-phosphoglucomutase-like phosphatase (HAD superfamily)